MWGIILGLFAVGLLATGALKAVQLSSIIVALPLMPVLILMVPEGYFSSGRIGVYR